VAPRCGGKRTSLRLPKKRRERRARMRCQSVCVHDLATVPRLRARRCGVFRRPAALFVGRHDVRLVRQRAPRTRVVVPEGRRPAPPEDAACSQHTRAPRRPRPEHPVLVPRRPLPGVPGIGLVEAFHMNGATGPCPFSGTGGYRNIVS
jgi:hypothetical protein